jgi:hypothetical protein
MTGKRALPKLVVFKLFVLATTLQNVRDRLSCTRHILTWLQFVFNIIKSHVKGGPKVTYDDITVGVPALLVCVEAVFFMIGYFVFFNAKEYKDRKVEAGSSYSLAQALLHAMNPGDLIHGIARAFKR